MALLSLLEKRRKAKLAIEFFAPDADDEEERFRLGQGHSFVRLRHLRTDDDDDGRFAVLLFEYVDQAVRSFPVVHTATFEGRELSGADEERGAIASHTVIRLPTGDAYDDGSYRCTLEAVPRLSRTMIEGFLRRQLGRSAEWTFTVQIQKKKKVTERIYKYSPRLELHADVGRSLKHAVTDGRILSHMLFTKRATKQEIGKPTAIEHEEVIADVEIRISAKQGPEDPAERRGWAGRLKGWYESLGYESRLYFRTAKTGMTLSGEVHSDVSSAADLLMCPKEPISLSKAPRPWRPTIHAETVEKMKELLGRDELWQRGE